MTPYPQKRHPARRIALKKHESMMAVKDQEIQRKDNLIAMLNKELSMAQDHLSIAEDAIAYHETRAKRAELIIDKLIGMTND